MAIWVVATAMLFLTAPKLADIVSHTSLVLVISSDSSLTTADDEYVQAFDTYFTKNKDCKVSLVYLNVNAAPYSDQATNTLKQVNGIINSGKIELDGTIRAQPKGLNIYVTGDAAISSEQHEATKSSMAIVTKITIFLLLLILTIGLSFIISRGFIGFLTWGGFKISTFTETFLIAVISSGGTVVMGFLFMIFARFGLFSTTGPSVATGMTISRRGISFRSA